VCVTGATCLGLATGQKPDGHDGVFLRQPQREPLQRKPAAKVGKIFAGLAASGVATTLSGTFRCACCFGAIPRLLEFDGLRRSVHIRRRYFAFSDRYYDRFVPDAGPPWREGTHRRIRGHVVRV